MGSINCYDNSFDQGVGRVDYCSSDIGDRHVGLQNCIKRIVELRMLRMAASGLSAVLNNDAGPVDQKFSPIDAIFNCCFVGHYCSHCSIDRIDWYESLCPARLFNANLIAVVSTIV